jgi:hypothetical protein
MPQTARVLYQGTASAVPKRATIKGALSLEGRRPKSKRGLQSSRNLPRHNTGCPTLAAFLSLPLGWDSTNPTPPAADTALSQKCHPERRPRERPESKDLRLLFGLPKTPSARQWVPHPRGVLVFAARVGHHNPQHHQNFQFLHRPNPAKHHPTPGGNRPWPRRSTQPVA